MMMAFAWAVGIDGDRKGEELHIEEPCLLLHVYLSLILLIFCETYYVRLIVCETSDTDTEDTGMGWSSSFSGN